MNQLPIAPCERILRSAGNLRVSEEAAKALRDILEDYAKEIASKAEKLALHANRKL